MTDPVFPLPEPTFLWVHTLIYVPHESDEVVVDDEGRWRYADQPSTTFTGYITAPNPTELNRADARGLRLDAVALAPRDLIFGFFGSIISPDGPYGLAGTYKVSEVRPNPSHTRLLLTRFEPDPYPPRYPSASSTADPSTVGAGAGI